MKNGENIKDEKEKNIKKLLYEIFKSSEDFKEEQKHYLEKISRDFFLEPIGKKRVANLTINDKKISDTNYLERYEECLRIMKKILKFFDEECKPKIKDEELAKKLKNQMLKCIYNDPDACEVMINVKEFAANPEEIRNGKDKIKNFCKQYEVSLEAIKKIERIKFTADGLLSLNKILDFSEDISTDYEDYRKIPIFYFPKTESSINTLRASVFGDRIDLTLYDLKMFYEGKRCLLHKAYCKPETFAWLYKLGSFEALIDDFFKVKGIFTDDEYNVYDLEINNGETLISGNYVDLDYNPLSEYSHKWDNAYYENVKKKKDDYLREIIKEYLNNPEDKKDQDLEIGIIMKEYLEDPEGEKNKDLEEFAQKSNIYLKNQIK